MAFSNRSLIALVLIFVWLIASSEPVATQESGEEDQVSQTPAGESVEEPTFVQTEVVFVEDELPYIPTSNTVVTKLPMPLRLTPASVAVISAALIEEQRGVVLGDALENVSGVNVHTGNGVYDFFVVRGFDSVSSELILTDGAPEPESSFYQLYNAERVEVLKGPSAFVYGGSPLAGTVNLVRKQPIPSSFLRLGGTYGSFATVEGTLDANVSNEDGSLGFRLNSLWRESQGYRDDKDSRNLAINPAFSWRPGTDTVLNVNFEYMDSQYSSDAGLPLIGRTELPDVPRRRSYQSPFDISDQEVGRFQIDFETRLSDRLVLRDKAYYRSFDWLSKATVFNGVFPVPGASPVIDRSLLLLDDAQEFVGNQIEVLLRLGSGRHSLLAGLEVARFADKFSFDVGLLPPIDLFEPVERAQEPVFLVPGQSRAADARSLVAAPYLVDNISFGERLQLLLGLRFDTIDFKDEVSGIERQDDQLSPMLGLVYSPSASLALYANASEAFAPPSTFALEEDQVPEESRQLEIGAKKGFLDGKVETTLALYEIERRNIAIPDDNGVTRQTGDQRSRGLEVEIAGEPRPKLRLFLAYAYTESELTEFTEQILVGFPPPIYATVDRSGNTPAFAPKHILNFWIGQRFKSGFGVGGGGRWVSEQYIDADNLFEIDAYFTLDATLYYTFGRWQLNLNLENLTDEEYFTRGFGGTSVIPASGTAAYAGIHYSF